MAAHWSNLQKINLSLKIILFKDGRLLSNKNLQITSISICEQLPYVIIISSYTLGVFFHKNGNKEFFMSKFHAVLTADQCFLHLSLSLFLQQGVRRRRRKWKAAWRVQYQDQQQFITEWRQQRVRRRAWFWVRRKWMWCWAWRWPKWKATWRVQ